MRKFQCLLFVLKPSYICYYIICVTVATFKSELSHSQVVVVLHTETSQVICSANQVNGFYMKYNTNLKLINVRNLFEVSSKYVKRYLLTLL